MMKLDPYAIGNAVLAPCFDVGIGLLLGRVFWSSQMAKYNDRQVTADQVKYFLDRCQLIASHLAFLGWWPMSLVGTVARAYPIRWMQYAFVVSLLVVSGVWLYSFLLPFLEREKTLVGRRSLDLCRFVGYGISIALAVVVGGAE
jgi:hypothetical protein